MISEYNYYLQGRVRYEILREKLGITTSEIAKILEIDPMKINDWESGLFNISPEQQLVYANFLIEKANKKIKFKKQ
jgi:transcriptional regulator with XRE-family HTH domain